MEEWRALPCLKEAAAVQQQLPGTWQELTPRVAQSSDLSREARDAGGVSVYICVHV